MRQPNECTREAKAKLTSSQIDSLRVLLSFCVLPFVVIKVALFTLFYLIPSCREFGRRLEESHA
jgi:hypothetical protein